MMTSNVPSADQPPFWEAPHTVEKPIDLLRFLGIFISRWPFLVGMGLLGLLVALAVSFALTPRFTAQAVFLPPVQKHTATENPLSLFIKAPSSAVYTGLLSSDSILGDVVRSSGLEATFKAKDLQQARVTLKGITQVSTNSDDFVTIRVTHQDALLAQNIASSYLRALQRLETRLSVDQAAQQRAEYQTQLDEEKDALAGAEIALEKAQEASGVVLPQNQTLSGLSAIDSLRTGVRASQVALASLLQSRTEQAPEVVRLRSQIVAQQAQLGRLESNAASAPGGGLTAGQAPAVNLKFVQLEREVKYHQVLFDVMVREFQTARVQETSSAPGVQIVDYPELPLRKSWPNRTLFSLAGTVAGLVLGLIITFAKDRLRVLRADPEHIQSLQSFRDSWTGATFRP